MEDSTLPDPYVQKFLKNFEIAKINAEVDTIIAARYGVKSYPTTLILKANGSEIDRHVGYFPPVEFVGAIVNSLSGIGTLEDYMNKLAEKPGEIELLFEVAQKYRWRGDYGKAASFFQQIASLDPANGKGKTGESMYALAHMKYKDKDYAAANALWRKLSSTLPKDELAEDADLMAAYCYQKANDFKTARKEFNNFLKKYPNTEEKEWIAEQFAKMDKK